jgi:imidazolonepropionase-like amidohydrolase
MTALRACLFWAASLASAAALAQPGSQPATEPVTQPASAPTTTRAASTPTTTTPTTTTTTTQAAKEKDRFLAVINGRVHTVTGPVLDRATVLSKNGIIAAIGPEVVLPPECEVVDAAGLEVYPGLIAALAGGIHGATNPQDTSNVYGLNMLVALAGGITTALAGNDVAKLTFGTVEDMVVKPAAYVSLSYSTYKPLERAQLRADLERVRTYLRELQKYEREKATKKDAKPPDKDWIKDKFENYRKLLTHEAIAATGAQSTHELREIADLASTYDFTVVVRGAYEGWTVAPILGRAGVRAVISPREKHEPDEQANRPTGSTIENAHLLRDAGVTLAIVPQTATITLWGLAGRDLLQLNLEAAFAVRGGLSGADALRAITIDAARVLGVDDRVGSLEVGKDADIVVCDGDLLHYMTLVRYTIVNGRVAYDKAKESLYAHIRPTGQREVPQFDDQWPRRLEWPGEITTEARRHGGDER